MKTDSAKQTDATEQSPLEDTPQEEAILEDPARAAAEHADAPVPTFEQVQADLAAAQAELEGLRDQGLRVRAEMENLRRRHTLELEKAHKYALDSFVRELLQVRDSLELGQAAALAANADVEKIREGQELTLKLMSDVMTRFGVNCVDPLDEPFDPEYHQAMSLQPRDDVPPNTVVTVIQKGYTLNGRLVRPALVMVSQQGA
ncbi:nucleotide exchange factor GrpE [Thiocapsa imhoffii]|uniref:Protein GrpE n=1 Tax=Thiocapsa imhoffii TaxID=382777 RepID=A0A9X1B904_9GAMM|nr:nucleotide exchange factor GrpE [Thiocapsa imhoffii]MBK1645454.1 nucleotide exchange factor GrpE [Thiocapsa imhoffii]